MSRAVLIGGHVGVRHLAGAVPLKETCAERHQGTPFKLLSGQCSRCRRLRSARVGADFASERGRYRLRAGASGLLLRPSMMRCRRRWRACARSIWIWCGYSGGELAFGHGGFPLEAGRGNVSRTRSCGGRWHHWRIGIHSRIDRNGASCRERHRRVYSATWRSPRQSRLHDRLPWNWLPEQKLDREAWPGFRADTSSPESPRRPTQYEIHCDLRHLLTIDRLKTSV